MNMTPRRITSVAGRKFAMFPAAVGAFILNDAEEFLLLRPIGTDIWYIPNGALESGESPLEGISRELGEELGSGFLFRPLGPLHVSAFDYDENVTNVLSVQFVVQYLGGEPVPSDDMLDAEFRWFRANEIETNDAVWVPRDWDLNLFPRALELFRLWKTHDAEADQSGVGNADSRRA